MWGHIVDFTYICQLFLPDLRNCFPMKITVLTDNRPSSVNNSLEVEHGLSFYIETAGEKIMLDVGASDMFLRNAGRLGIDIAEVDYLVLSHAHNDHTGGLKYFLRHNDKAKVYISSRVDGSRYYSTRRGGRRDISIDFSLMREYADRFVRVTGNMVLTSSARIIGNIPASHILPMANRTLLAGDNPDTFDHEMGLLLMDRQQTVLLSSCTHLGLLNTLEACVPVVPGVFIGGMHLVDSDPGNRFETEEDYKSISAAISSRYPGLEIYTGHCTGNNAQAILSRLMPGRFHTFHVGYEWPSHP